MAIDVARDLVLDIRISSQDRQLPIALRYRNHMDQAVHKIQDALSRQIDYPWNEDELASLVHKSYRQVSRIFKHNTGIGIKEYQMQIRVDYGRKLLLNTDLTINEIAHRCGYEHAQTFRRAWHKYEQLNPLQYRRTNNSQS